MNQQWEKRGLSVRVSDLNHGKRHTWLDACSELPYVEPSTIEFNDVIRIGQAEDFPESDLLNNSIECLIPWRKGPFNLFGNPIDSEWRSNLKWDRIAPHIDLAGKRILDIGASNGYFGYRMLEAGAKTVLGVESSELFILQAALVNFYLRKANVVVPHRYERSSLSQQFDVVFSMGVSYHQRNLQDHLAAIYENLEHGGELILESLWAPEDIVPDSRYANMRNVWLVPTSETVLAHLLEAGFEQSEVLDVSVTTVDEQRTTSLSPGFSLVDSLDPENSALTIEGYPAPQRAVLKAVKT